MGKTNFHIFIVMVLIVLASMLMTFFETPNVEGDKIYFGSAEDLRFGDDADLRITMGEIRNHTGNLIIKCNYYQPYDNEFSVFYWIYPMCAMLETNSELELHNYDIKFKEYNMCIELMNNKTVGDCSP